MRKIKIALWFILFSLLSLFFVDQHHYTMAGEVGNISGTEIMKSTIYFILLFIFLAHASYKKNNIILIAALIYGLLPIMSIPISFIPFGIYLLLLGNMLSLPAMGDPVSFSTIMIGIIFLANFFGNWLRNE